MGGLMGWWVDGDKQGSFNALSFVFVIFSSFVNKNTKPIAPQFLCGLKMLDMLESYPHYFKINLGIKAIRKSNCKKYQFRTLFIKDIPYHMKGLTFITQMQA